MKPMFLAGRLDKRVIVKYLVEAQDSFGGADATWTTLKTVWASINPVSARDFIQGQQAQSETSHKIITRASGITKNMRVYFGTRIFEISGVLNKDEKGAEYTIMAKEIT